MLNLKSQLNFCLASYSDFELQIKETPPKKPK